MKKFLKPVIFVVLGLAVGAAGMFGASKVLSKDADTVEHAAPGKRGKEPAPVGILYQAKERVVNLADPGALRYIKIAVALEIEDPSLKGSLPKGEAYKKAQEELSKEIKPVSAVIDDQITSILTAKTSAQLTTPDGKERLKTELQDRINHALHEHHKVLNIYFSEFVIQ